MGLGQPNSNKRRFVQVISTTMMKTIVAPLTFSLAALIVLFCNDRTALSFSPTLVTQLRRRASLQQGNHNILAAAKAGSFFNPVPEDEDEEEGKQKDDIDGKVKDLLRDRKKPSKASQPSTINGVPTREVGKGFATGQQKINPPGDQKPFVGIGPPLNDVTKPEYDDQGYTLYADEVTGEKSRVFEALVEYPCDFTLKIVGANEGLFVEEMVAVVAESCQVEVNDIKHTTRENGKWTSVTVQAPVQSAEMLYQLYENVDRDPRVRFKF